MTRRRGHGGVARQDAAPGAGVWGRADSPGRGRLCRRDGRVMRHAAP